VFSYMRGPGGVGAVSRDFDGTFKSQPKAAQAMQRMYEGHTFSQADFPTPGNPQLGRLVQAFDQGGPAGAVNYLAQTGAKGAGMTDLLRTAEMKGMQAAILAGDFAGAQHVRDMIFQISQQGAASNLMAAHQALIAGDGVGAAQALARAHAFFPDGSIGRFGVDNKGQVWAQRVDERDPSKTLGSPFQVTPTALVSQLMMTRDPAQYVKMVTEQQQSVAHMRQMNAMADFYQLKPALETARTEELARSREQVATINATARTDAARIRSGAQRDALMNEAANVFQKDDAGTYAGMDAGDRAMASEFYVDARRGGATPSRAQYLADGLVKGVTDPRTGQTTKFVVHPQARNADGSYKVLNPATKTVEGNISPDMYTQLAARHLAGVAPIQPPAQPVRGPVGAGAGTAGAIAAGLPGSSLGGGSPGAIDTTQMPSTMVH
jgi:hypothetical protein